MIGFCNSFRPLIIVILLCLSVDNLQAQTRVKLFSERDKNEQNDYIIYADNPTGKTQHVVVVFTDLVGYIPSVRKPPSINIDIGRTKLFKLKRDELSSQANFRYVYYVYPGTANPKIKKVNYALPLMPGKKTEVIALSNAKEVFGKEPVLNDFYGFAFKGSAGDTICAARGGRIKKIVQDATTEGDNIVFSNTKNFIEVRHVDGTIARYNIFKAGSAMVTEGEDILAGTPLALMSGSQYEMGPHFRFYVNYLFYEYKQSLKSNEWYEFRYINPKFETTEGSGVTLTSRTHYTSVLNDGLITQEMSRGERKKYLKTKR